MSERKKRWSKMPKWAKYTIYAVLGIIGGVLLGWLFGNVIMWLWNWLMPKLFGLPLIGFWEGLGLFLLAKILFGFGGGSGSGEGEKKHPHHGKRRHHHGDAALQRALLRAERQVFRRDERIRVQQDQHRQNDGDIAEAEFSLQARMHLHGAAPLLFLLVGNQSFK